MATTRYYNDMYVIDDKFRKKKYEKLLILSLTNDTSKWTKKLTSNNVAYYIGPDYNNSYFVVENGSKITCHANIAFVRHKKSVVPKESIIIELISDNFSTELEKAVKQIKEEVYTSELGDIEKLIGKNTKTDRKEKLQFIETEQIKELILDTYQDWLESENVVSAKLIAKIIYSYRKNDELYKLWLDKFDIDLIVDELNKLKK